MARRDVAGFLPVACDMTGSDSIKHWLAGLRNAECQVYAAKVWSGIDHAARQLMNAKRELTWLRGH